MAFDEHLAERVRDALGGHAGVTERRMFGSVVFMLDGNMCCGVNGDELILRLGEEAARTALDDPHARPFDLGSQPMKRWVMVHAEALTSNPDLRGWLGPAVEFASSLPSK